jgi:hypothetical protein
MLLTDAYWCKSFFMRIIVVLSKPSCIIVSVTVFINFSVVFVKPRVADEVIATFVTEIFDLTLVNQVRIFLNL